MDKNHIEYYNGNLVKLYKDGTKTRDGDNLSFYPESIDLKVTDYCNMGCAFCHEKSTVNGKHANLNVVIEALNKLPHHGGIELAIGGGNPLDWPEMPDFVSWARSRFTLNVTIHENHLKKASKNTKDLLHSFSGIGVSVVSSKSLNELIDHPHLVGHVIAGVHNFSFISELIKNNSRILILGYKNYGRGSEYISKKVYKEIYRLKVGLRNVMELSSNKVLAFDNLAIKQLKPDRFIKDWDKVFMGEDASHTMYLDAVKKEYAKNSYSVSRYPLELFPDFKPIRD